MKDAIITMKVSSDLKRDLASFAKLKGKTLSTLILDEIMLALRGYFIKCRKCKKPMFDTREIPMTGKGPVKCQHCGFEFEVNFDEL